MSTDNQETGVRAAQESDLAAVYDVWYRTDVLTDDLTTPPEKGPVPAYLRHVLATGKLVVAERNGDIVGFAGAVTRGKVDFLTDLFVDPLHQSGSLGKTLLRAAGGKRPSYGPPPPAAMAWSTAPSALTTRGRRRSTFAPAWLPTGRTSGSGST
jgi:hypothetical protein